MKQPFKSISRKIKVFLHRQKWKETLIFFAFVLLAFGFWYLQSLQQDYEIEISIPVGYRNVPPEISFTDSIPHKITARVRDKGSILLNYSFGRTFAPIEVNMKDMPIDNGSLTVERKDIEADLYKQLLATTQLISFAPSQIELTYSRRMEKEIPVSFDGNIQVAPGFHRSGDILISPRTVQVYAVQSVLDTLKEVKTVYTEIKKANKTLTRTVHMQPVNGVSYSPESVTVTIPIEEFTEKTLDVPVEVTDVPGEYIVRLFPQTVKVICSVPLSRFKDLTADLFTIRVPFAELEQNLTGTTNIQLSKQPDWIRSATLSPNRIEFILEQNLEND